MPSNEVEAIRKEVGCKCRGIILRFGWDWPLVLEQLLAQSINGGSVLGPACSPTPWSQQVLQCS